MTNFNPATLGEAADFLSTAAARGTTVGFVGSGSRVELGRQRQYEPTMGSGAMADVIDWLVEDLTIVVRAGMPVGELERLLATENQTSLLPTSEPNRTVGGLVAEGVSGFKRLKHGPTRDRVLEVSMATG